MLKTCLFAMACGLSAALLIGGARISAADPDEAGYREIFERQLRAAELKQSAVIEGRTHVAEKDGYPTWLFFTPEIRAVLSPPFWGEAAASASRSANPKFADPLAPILDFHAQLKSAGIDLLIVPVPAKAAIYPLEVSEKLGAMGIPSPRMPLDKSHSEFYGLLQAKGVAVVDLTFPFRMPNLELNPESELHYCVTDSHWSGRGCQVAAAELAKRIKNFAWYQPLTKTQYQTAPHTVEMTGDLAKLLDEKNPIQEKLALTRVFQMVNGKSLPVADDPQSPILLLGDSHTLVFHDPTLYAADSGLADHLAEQLGIAIDVIGVRGSGANAARLNWRRRAAPLANKKLVIWCFSMREFTENTDGWRVIPITKR